uniref:Basic tail secreted protein n=1 Tax=Rhipicephalus appendiculatus TaxID=34631 RepID=A0A131YNB5_RHIAP
MARPMLILLAVSAGLVESFHRETGKHCQRLGKQPSEQTPAKHCWFHCYDEDRNIVHRRLESYGTPCLGRRDRPLGFCWGSHCYQDRFGRRPPWSGPPGNSGRAGAKPTGSASTTAGPPTSGPNTPRTTGPPSSSAVDRNSTTNEKVPKKQPQK